MKRLHRLIFSVAFFFFTLVLLTGCSFKSLELKSINSVNYTTTDRGTKQVQANVTFYNPNRLHYSVSEMDIDVLIGGKYLGKLKSPELFEVARKSNFNINLYIDIETTELLKNSVTLLKALAIGEIELTLKGNLQVKYLKVNRTIPIENVQKVKFK